jgi:hypothetical protein
VPPRGTNSLLAAGGESGGLCAFDESGRLAWVLPLRSAVCHTALLRRQQAAPLLAAGCKDGRLFLVTTEGKLASWFDTQAPLQELLVADVDADGHEEIIAATTNPARLWTVRAP